MHEAAQHVVTLVVPAYRRPMDLRACLEHVAALEPGPDEVIVVTRPDDAATREVVRDFPWARLLDVEVPGQMAAMRAGAAAASGDILAFTDDDARPRSDWLGRLLRHFDDPRVGAVGGRDEVWHGAEVEQGRAWDVGRVTWAGRIIGNHHLGWGPPRDVAIVKGVNMAWRRAAFCLPIGLRGRGAEVHNEVATGLEAGRRGWRLVYDPAAEVTHHPAIRFDEDRRGAPSAIAIRDQAHNASRAVAGSRGWRAIAVAARGVAVGERPTPGLLRYIAGRMRLAEPVYGLRPAMAGRIDALKETFAGPPLTFWTPEGSDAPGRRPPWDAVQQGGMAQRGPSNPPDGHDMSGDSEM